jgi:methylmalonyl-CoA epimerase
MIQLIDHVAITVRDLEETVDFYAKLGFKVGTRSESPTQITLFLEAGEARLEIFAPKHATSSLKLSEKDQGVKHVAIKVDDIWQAYREARSRGIVFEDEPKRTPLGNIVAFFRDPNGVLLQLLQR